MSNVVFAGGIGYPLYITVARQEIHVADVLPREAYGRTVTLEYEEVLKPLYSSFKNDVFRHVSEAHVRTKMARKQPQSCQKGFLYVLSLFLKPLRLKGGFLMKILMSRFCSGI